MERRIILSVIIVIMAALTANATLRSENLKPRWVSSELPKPTDPSYYNFYRAEGSGFTKDEANMNAFVNLTDRLERVRGYKVVKSVDTTKTFNTATGKNKNKEVKIQVIEEGKHIDIVCREIDKYWEYKNGEYRMWILYTVNNINHPTEGSSIDNIYLSTSYGAAPVFYSLIPGVGQMYKGSTTKGGIILGSAVVVGAGIVTAESMRASYIKKMKEYPKHHDFYNNKATTWKNIRNVALGVGAGLYVYNLIDAAVAGGSRHVKVSRNYRYNYSLAPIWNGENMELAFTLNF